MICPYCNSNCLCEPQYCEYGGHLTTYYFQDEERKKCFECVMECKRFDEIEKEPLFYRKWYKIRKGLSKKVNIIKE